VVKYYSWIVLAEGANDNPWVIIGVAFVACVDGRWPLLAAGLSAQARRRERSSADHRSRQIEADSRRKEAEVEAKEMALREKSRIESSSTKRAKRYLNASDNSTNNRIMLSQRSDQLQKQDKNG